MGEVIRLDDPAVLVRLRRSARARRFTLSLRPGEAEPRLTAPAAAAAGEARRFLERQSGWLREAIARVPAAVAAAPGAMLPVDGRMTPVEAWAGRGCRFEGGRLLAPEAGAGPAIAAFLRRHAAATMGPEARRAAALLGREIARIGFRDTRSRWGSCSSGRTLSFSWRLAMAPPEVRAYVALHEAAHLVEMNHGPEFWRLVARLDPGYRRHRAWLRREGAALHRYRFGE